MAGEMAMLSLLANEEPVGALEPLFVIRVVDPPRPKQRARTVRHGQRTYTPKQTENAAYRVRQAVIEKYGDPQEGAFQPFEGPVFLRFTAWLKMPTAIPRYKRPTALPLKTPDLPNMVMLLADALSGYAYLDDKLVTDSQERKRYAGTYGGPNFPCWEVEVFESKPELW
ncbi:MAG: hypothetical protein DLM66_00235 [Candidatus Dormiibacter spiritus]|nr:MAG: hypothetical protein DLM66_00235 [Candidatus Dormibacteraeota bacterium]